MKPQAAKVEPGFGAQIFSTLSGKFADSAIIATPRQLIAEFGRGFGQRNLFRMVRFAEVFPDPKILTSLMSKLGWTHFLHLIRLDEQWNDCHYSNEFKKKARK